MVNKEMEESLNLVNRSIVDLMELRNSLLKSLSKDSLNTPTIGSSSKIDFKDLGKPEWIRL